MVIGNFLGNALAYDLWMIKPSSIAKIQEASKFDLSEEERSKLLAHLNTQTDPDMKERRYCDIPMDRVGNKLIVRVEGTMVPKGSWIDTYFGYIGMDGLSNIFNDAREDITIDHVVIMWDCPGSTAVGAYELATVLNDLRKVKRVTSFCVGMMCSGAYLTGSTADEIYSSSKINEVGSIGVLAIHQELSKMYENVGVKITCLRSGKYKALGNPYEPLSEEAKNELMRTMDITYQEFKTTVQINRNLTEEELNSVVEGRVFAAVEAVDNKLIDGITTLSEILSWEGAH